MEPSRLSPSSSPTISNSDGIRPQPQLPNNPARTRSEAATAIATTDIAAGQRTRKQGEETCSDRLGTPACSRFGAPCTAWLRVLTTESEGRGIMGPNGAFEAPSGKLNVLGGTPSKVHRAILLSAKKIGLAPAHLSRGSGGGI